MINNAAMNSNKIKESFDRYYEAPPKIWNKFIDSCETVEFAKAEL